MSEFPIAVLGSASALLALVCLFAAAVITKRTRSTHVIAFRLWRLIHGNGPINDHAVRRFVDDQSSLMAFRFISGIRTASLSRAVELIDEIRSRGIDVHDLRLAGRLVDTSSARICIRSIPKGWERIFAFGLSVTLCAAGTVAICGVFYDGAILSFARTGPTFVMDSVAAKALRRDTALWRSDCATPQFAFNTGFAPQQIAEICQKWGKNPHFVSRTVSKQRTAFGILAALCLYVLQFPLGYVMSSLAALRLKSQLSKSP